MECGQSQMPGFGYAESRLNGFEITHLTYENDIGVLAKRDSECTGETLGILGYFPLIDNTFFVLMNKLNRVLNSKDMPFTFTVDFINHCGKSSAFSAPSRPGDKNQPVWPFGQFTHNSRESQVREWFYSIWNLPDGTGAASSLEKNIGPVP